MLRSEGYEVFGARSLPEGLRLARELRPNIVLLNIPLSDPGGFDLCREIKTEPALTDVLVVMVSEGLEQAPGQLQSVGGGPDEFIGIGVPPAEFLLRIRAIVRLQQALANLRAEAQDSCREVESALQREILDITDHERRRIGHELHDGLGQYLAGIAFRAKALEQALLSHASPHASEAGELTRLISSAIGQVRSLAHGLDAVEVEHTPLPHALAHLAAETEHLFGVTCLCRVPEPGLETDARTRAALYRMAQEAIHNAIIHGKARLIEIHLSVAGPVLCMLVRDYGSGFEVGTTSWTGMGLRVMEYRARSIGATLNIASRPGEGTHVKCSVPRIGSVADGNYLSTGPRRQSGPPADQ
jgi:signal transduction histidine kinase